METRVRCVDAALGEGPHARRHYSRPAAHRAAGRDAPTHALRLPRGADRFPRPPDGGEAVEVAQHSTGQVEGRRRGARRVGGAGAGPACANEGEAMKRAERPEKVNLAKALASINEHWSPHVAGELNGQHVKLVKFKGEFVWHHHEHEDELFLVINGRFTMELR